MITNEAQRTASDEAFRVIHWTPERTDITLGCVDLLSRTFPNEEFTSNSFVWKHGRNPCGLSLVWVAICQRSQKVVSLRALWRHEIVVEGRPLTAFQSCDSATDPSYRRCGLFRALNDHGIRAAKEEGVPFIFNFPNQYSKPGYLKQGWRDVGGVYVLGRPARYSRILRLARSNAHWSSFQGAERSQQAGNLCSVLKDLDNDVVDLLEADIQTSVGTIQVRKSRDYLMWRFGSRPDRHYIGVCTPGFLGITSERMWHGLTNLHLVYFAAVDRKALMDGLAKVNSVAEEHGAEIVTTILSTANPHFYPVARAGFFPIPSRINFVVREVCGPETPILHGTRWAISAADLDSG